MHCDEGMATKFSERQLSFHFLDHYVLGHATVRHACPIVMVIYVVTINLDLGGWLRQGTLTKEVHVNHKIISYYKNAM